MYMYHYDNRILSLLHYLWLNRGWSWTRIDDYIHFLCWYRSFSRPYVGLHYCDVTMGAIASQITSLTIVYSTVYSDADQRKHQSSASLAFYAGNSPVPGSPHKRPVTRKMFSFDDVIMASNASSWLDVSPPLYLLTYNRSHSVGFPNFSANVT